MAPATSDSPVSRRIVRSFLEFLRNVQLAPETDREGLKVAKECLASIFKVDVVSPTDEFSGHELLVDFVESLAHQAERPARRSFAAGSAKDEICRKFHETLQDKDIIAIDYSMLRPSLPNSKAHELMNEAIAELEDSGCRKFNNENVAETLNSLGNRAKESNKMVDAIQFYTCAIALCAENPIYYSNRAAAFIEISDYRQAVEDCRAATELGPYYWKAYVHLGTINFALGRYTHAITVFKKALELNPDSPTIKEKIQEAEQKLEEELRQGEEQQNPSLDEGPGVESH